MSGIAKLPHLCKKFLDMAREIASLDLNSEIPRGELRRNLASRFRITRSDVDVTIRELEQQKLLERAADKRRVRLRR